MYFAFRMLGCLFGTWGSVFGKTECLIYIMEYVFGVWEHLFWYLVRCICSFIL